MYRSRYLVPKVFESVIDSFEETDKEKDSLRETDSLLSFMHSVS